MPRAQEGPRVGGLVRGIFDTEWHDAFELLKVKTGSTAMSEAVALIAHAPVGLVLCWPSEVVAKVAINRKADVLVLRGTPDGRPGDLTGLVE
jgi:hypothetical protein